VPSGLVGHDGHGPADRRVGIVHGRCAERDLVARRRRNPGGDHRLGRAGTAKHERHQPELADAHTGKAAPAVAGDLRVGAQRGGGFGQPPFGRHERIPGEPGQPGCVEQVAEAGGEDQRDGQGGHAEGGAKDCRPNRDRRAAAAGLQRHPDPGGHGR
jgi:hypothetical protein